MRLLLSLLLLGSTCTAAHAADTPPRPPVHPIHADKVILVGDSTTAVGSGWGAAFCADHATSFLACVNLARGGRSTYNYRAEGSWDIALHEMRSGGYERTWVLIQFGHNDQPGKPGRSTDLASEFPANLRRYVEEVRAAGAIPVLVTPLTRRQFRDGRLLDDLAPWAAAVRTVAAQMQVPLVDLHARSQALVQALGPLLSMRLAQAPANAEQVAAAQAGTSLDAAAPAQASAAVGPTTALAAAAATPADNAALEPMGQPKRAFDYTHLGPAGADLFAAIVADELARSVPQMRRLLLP